ncbi:MAG TPA: hypothetical protein VLG49_06400 [Rhabdochlamydiaceae bacterium]|nr:hypothetical protein [Rhabdochlamydiaceae bacterium]
MNSQLTEFSTIPCELFTICSGCQLNEHVISPPIWEEIKHYFFSKGLDAPCLYHKEIIQWRNRVKLAIRGNAENPQIGLFKRGTHEVLSIPSCPMHHPKINLAIQSLIEFIKKIQVQPYCENRHRGELRYCQLVVERTSGKVQLSLVVNDDKITPSLSNLAEQLSGTGLFHSIWINFQPAATNRIFGDKWILCWGEPLLWEEFNGISVCFHPACFGQAHFSLFEEMLKSIQRHVLPEKRILELYAGVGVIGLSVASTSTKLICSEINPHAKDCFEAAIKKLPSEVQNKTSFVLGAAESSTHLLADADVLIVDPPRKGLDPKLLSAIADSRLEQIIYVSCGPFSFMRDCDELLNHGWRLDKAEGYLLFPGTDHVELIGYFKR